MDCVRRDETIYDVVVVGGGTAGSAAAISAARAGAKVLLVERLSCLGGTGTAGQVVPMMSAGVPEPEASLNRELIQRLAAEGGSGDDGCGNSGWLNPELEKFILEDMFVSAGGHLLYDTAFLEATVEQDRISSILVHNRSGMSLVKGRAYIDCTGDAALAYAAGVPCRKGDGASHRNQAVSLRFMMGNVDLIRLDSFLREIGQEVVLKLPFLEMCFTCGDGSPLCRLFQKAVEEKKLEPEDTAYFQAFSVPGMPGMISFNCPEISRSVDCLDAQQTSLALVTGRKMIRRLARFLQSSLPGFENSHLSNVAPMLGIRESREIAGAYTLTDEDYRRRSKFDDGVAKTAYPIDIHGFEGEQNPMQPMTKREYMDVPFRCMVPLNVENLLVAGRCVSASFAAQSAIRIQPTCRAMGEAAGAAAAYGVLNEIRLNTDWKPAYENSKCKRKVGE